MPPQVEGRAAPPRAPQSAKHIHGVSLLITFLFAPLASKRKVAGEIALVKKKKGKPHLWFPLFPLRGNSPFRALSNDKGVSPPAGDDQGSAFGNRKLLKKFDQNFPQGVCVT